MAPPLSPEDRQTLIAAYVLGDLSAEEAAAYEGLLAADPSVAAETQQLQQALESAYGAPEVAPPPYLRAAVLAAAAQPAAVADPRRRSLPWRGVLEAVAAGLILVLGVSTYRLSQDLATAQAETRRYASLTYQLLATQANSTATASVTVDPNRLEATLVVRNLPPLPAGKVYALWTVLPADAPFTVDSKGAILTEAFQVNAQGEYSQVIVVPKAFRSQAWVRKVAITIEEAQAPQKHVGSPILITGS